MTRYDCIVIGYGVRGSKYLHLEEILIYITLILTFLGGEIYAYV